MESSRPAYDTGYTMSEQQRMRSSLEAPRFRWPVTLPEPFIMGTVCTQGAGAIDVVPAADEELPVCTLILEKHVLKSLLLAYIINYT